jgi:RHS repeat-associated protein
MSLRFISLIFCLLTTVALFSEDEQPCEDLFLSTPDQIATLTGESSFLVGGLISPLSGQPVLRQTDLIVKGAQNIVLSRVYIPPYMPCAFPKHKRNQEEYDKRYLYRHLQENYKGWQLYPHLRLELNPRSMQVRLSDPSGITLDFRLSGQNYSTATLASPSYAINNTSGDIPSGKYDPRNTRISYEENGNKITVHAADGAIRFYSHTRWLTKTSHVYLLAKEILPNGKVLKYHYTYEDYDEDGNLISENLIGNLGQVIHTTDLRGQKASISSPYFSQECKYDPAGNPIHTMINGAEHRYSYDGLSQLSSENNASHSEFYLHDSLYNRIQKNGSNHEINDLNELLSLEDSHYSYDFNGNQILKQTPSETSRFTYDSLNQLIEVTSENKKVNFIHDPLGRRLSKIVSTPAAHGWKETTHEHYLYHGQNEIGAFTSHNDPKNLRILGPTKYNPATIAIELEGHFFAPLLDAQGNIRRLIDPISRTVANSYEFTAFGEELPTNSSLDLPNPWRFASKRFDPELGLLYFGKRYYDPLLGRWLTTDPAGFVDSVNLYQYVFNNPFHYTDPDGQFIQLAIPLLIWGAEAVLPALSAYAAPLIYGAITGAVAYGGYKAVQALNARDHSNYSPADNYANYSMKFEASSEEEEKKKRNTNPFDGPVGGDVVVVDEAGNAIKIPQGNWSTGSKDGKWIQEMQPGKNPEGQATGTRKDGGHPRGPKHSDPRALEPHAHVPGISNPDGTPWLPVKK